MAPPPLPRMQELLAEGDFVRSLARQLIGSADGDDLAQDTWLTVLRRGPFSEQHVQQPRAWLARIAARLAANRRRTDSRRAAREHSAAATRAVTAPSTDEILACEQVRQRVVAAVLALDEPFRGTVLARFYECLDTAAIAARDGVEEATARSRLKRGLERLRARLDSEHGARAAWAGPLVMLGRDPNAPLLPAGVAMSTSQKAGAAALVLLAGGFVAWQVMPDAPPLTRRDAVATAAPAAAADPTSDEQALRRDAMRADTASDARPTGAPREALPYPVVDEPTAEVTVCVLDVETRRPVADAEVLYQPFRIDFGGEHARGDRELHEVVSSDAFLERFGHRNRTGANGEAVIVLPRSGGPVHAQRGDRIATAHPDPEKLVAGERLLLWLDEARWLRFRVVDESTRSPVAGALLYVSSSATGPVVPVSCGYGSIAGPADRDGMIRMPWSGDKEARSVRPWALCGARSIPLDEPGALQRITEVPYPATGSLTIELRTPSGELWPTRINASVRIDGGDSWSSAGPTGWCSATPGIYRVPHVGLGLRLQVSAMADRTHDAGGKTVVAGPTQPGEDVRIVLHTPQAPCIVWADVRFADGGVPPLGVWASVLQDRTDGDQLRRWGYLEPGGRVGWTVAPGSSARGHITLSRVDSSDPELARGEWQVEQPTPGVHELGTIVVKEAGMVVAGRVDGGARSRSGPALHVDCETQAADGTWERAYGLSAPVRADGTFEVRGVTTAERLRVSLRVDRRVLPPDAIVVERGALDVRLVVASSVVLRARVLPPPAYLQAVTCRVARADGAPLPKFRERPYDDDEIAFADARLVATDGEAAQFVWPALPAGTYTLEVRLPGLSAPVRTFDGVRVEDGIEPDARLAAIDLRREVRTLTVSVEPLPSGSHPISEGGVLAFRSGEPARTLHGLLFDARGEARLLVGPDPVDVIVAVPGHRLWQARAVTESSLAVQLEPCLPVRVRLAPRVAECFAGHRMYVQLEPRGLDEAGEVLVTFRRAGDRAPAVQTSRSSLRGLAGGGQCALDDSRATGTIPVSEAGAFELTLLVGQVAINTTQWGRRALLPERIDVRSADDPVVVIDLDDAVLPKVAEALSRQR